MLYAVDDARITEPDRKTRARLGFDPSRAAILFAWKFNPCKRLHELVSAFACLGAEAVAARLVMVGTGALEAEATARIAAEGTHAAVFPGIVIQSDLPSVHPISDDFAAIVERTLGPMVNEAMCTGRPIDEVGCVPDLVEAGVKAARFPAALVDARAEALRPLRKDRARRAEAGAASPARGRAWKSERYGEGIRAATEASRAEWRRRGTFCRTSPVDAHSRS